MAKWPKDAIEGVNVHKVIPRPTALRAVGKKFLLATKGRVFDPIVTVSTDYFR
jgi:hypothetical protein